MKTYNKAPLPFQGQKRNFVKKFRETLQEFPDDAIYIDLFGGSGLLSHNVKATHPNAKVIYNDFDNYSQRLANIDKTNKLISDIRGILQGVPKLTKIVEPLRSKILNRIKREPGFVDYLTLSSQILFAGRYAQNLEELEKQTLHNRVISTDYSNEDYLKGVEVISIDYKELFKKYENHKNVVFLLDPPYLSTDVTTYTNMNYWKLTNYLDIVKTIAGKSFVYFTSEKNQIVELLHWLDSNKYISNPFTGAIISKTTVTASTSASYQDIMITKKAV